VTEQEHLLRQLGMRDVEESAERMVIEMDNRPNLVNVRGALQGGLVATLIESPLGAWRVTSSALIKTSPPRT
jgi:acyl-coenzyme A thioesterase PaaI-like protein